MAGNDRSRLIREDAVENLAFELAFLVLVQRADTHVPDSLPSHPCLQPRCYSPRPAEGYLSGAGASSAGPGPTRSVGADGLISYVGGAPVKDECANFLFGLVPDGKVDA